MGRCARFLSVIAGAGVLLTVAVPMVVRGASLEDGKAAFERREDTMKHMGRPFYLGIGHVVKGTAAYGPDTVTAAETVASLASTLDRTLFPAVPMWTGAGSNLRYSPPRTPSIS
jgi:cytochrome c556